DRSLSAQRTQRQRSAVSVLVAVLTHSVIVLARRTETLKDFFANARIILRDDDDGVVLVDRKALVLDRLHQGGGGLIGNALFIRCRRFLESLLKILLDRGDPRQGGRCCIELLVGQVRRRISERRRRGWDLGIGGGNAELPHGHQSRCRDRSCQQTHRIFS